jgi:hypothetical protein
MLARAAVLGLVLAAGCGKSSRDDAAPANEAGRGGTMGGDGSAGRAGPAAGSGGTTSACSGGARDCVAKVARACAAETWGVRKTCQAACGDGRCIYASPGLGDTCAGYDVSLAFDDMAAFSCRWDLPSARGMEADAGAVSFQDIDGSELVLLPHVESADDCVDGAGWYFDPAPPTVALCPADCREPPSLKVDISLKCNTL